MRNRPSPGHDLEAKAIGVRIEAQNMLPDPKRTEALLKEAKLRNAADTYEYLFSNEFKSSE